MDGGLARIRDGRHRFWTADLVGDVLALAFQELPGRSIRVADSRIEPTHQPFSHVALPDFLELAGYCVENKTERGVMLYLAKRRALPDQGIGHLEAARYYGFKSRRGLYGAGNRARHKMACCLNEKWLKPPEVLAPPPLELEAITLIPQLS